MQNRVIIFMMMFIQVGLSMAQPVFHNNVWMWGYENGFPYPMGGGKITFESDTALIESDLRNLEFRGSMAYLQTPDRLWSIYTNGYAICNQNHDTITNGSGLCPGGYDTSYYSGGAPVFSSSTLLPFPGSDRLMVMMSLNLETDLSNPLVYSRKLYYHLIDPGGNNGRGLALIKNQIVVSDTLEIGGLLPVRHANGRDWWVVVRRHNTDELIRILITPTGPQVYGYQALSQVNGTSGGLSNFSPDGKQWATFQSNYGLRLFDFDRCRGLMLNLRQVNIAGTLAGFVSFSPNNRYLYACCIDTLWQFDTQASNLAASKIIVGVADTSVQDPYDGDTPFFFGLTLAEDGKIYVNNGNGLLLHVINKPNEAGSACDFVQGAIQLPNYYQNTLPSRVNLTLFQEPGSPCDTLGLGLQANARAEMRLYPNPVQQDAGLFFDQNTEGGTLFIYDMQGRMLYQQIIEPGTSYQLLPMGHFPSGIYQICYLQKSQRQSLRLCKTE